MTKISIIEDDSLFLDVLKQKLKSMPEIEEVNSFFSGEEFWRSKQRKHTDIALIDVNLPGMTGVELAGVLELHDSRITKLIISSINSERVITEAIKNGCQGYVLKTELEDLESTLRIILDGGAIISPGIAIRVLNALRVSNQKVEPSQQQLSALTNREKQIIELMANGKKPATVAESLSISVHTVRSQIRSIYRKLSIHNQQELMTQAIRLGLYQPEQEESQTVE